MRQDRRPRVDILGLQKATSNRDIPQAQRVAAMTKVVEGAEKAEVDPVLVCDASPRSAVFPLEARSWLLDMVSGLAHTEPQWPMPILHRGRWTWARGLPTLPNAWSMVSSVVGIHRDVPLLYTAIKI